MVDPKQQGDDGPADDEQVDGVLTTKKLLRSFIVEPLCDGDSGKDLSSDQVAALHAFLHEVLAAYYRASVLVPEDRVQFVLNRRFKMASHLKPPRVRR